MTHMKLLSDHRAQARSLVQGLDVGFIVRSPFERDYDRVLYSAPCRRLADKTQVFPLDRNDGVRTRLTHSLEVSSLGRAMGTHIVTETGVFDGVDSDDLLRWVPPILATAGLAHDIGNPPFGHHGEKVIQQWFAEKETSGELEGLSPRQKADLLSFEGNAQALRILVTLQDANAGGGLNLTSATIASCMKYTVGSTSVSTKHCARRKVGVFKSEQAVASQVLAAVGIKEGGRHPLAYLMEAADDIAYAWLDVEDAVKKRLASFDDVVAYLESNSNGEIVDRGIPWARGEVSKFCELRQTERSDSAMELLRVAVMSSMANSACAVFEEEREAILLGEFPGSLIEASEARSVSKALKGFAFQVAYQSRDVLRLESVGQWTIRWCMNALWDSIRACLLEEAPRGAPEKYAYSRISENYRRIAARRVECADGAGDRLYAAFQLLADMVSGMTDQFLMDLVEDLKGSHGAHG